MRADLSEQIQRFEEKYAENPDSLVFARLADLYRKAGDPDRALSLLEQGLERHPDYLSGHIVRARCLRDLGRPGEAGRAFDAVLEQDEQNLVALRGLAELARERGELEEAEQRYEELLALDPRNEEARAALDELVEGAPGPASAPPADGASDEETSSEVGPGAGAEQEGDDEGPWWRSEAPDDDRP
ncbi:MAG: tetratricopeptide repeat protein, partial [Gemmatimonadota bacterium]